MSSRLLTDPRLILELDALPGQEGAEAPCSRDDFEKDGTGIGQVWHGAANLLCDYLTAHAGLLFERAGSLLELGAGVGVPGLLAASLGAPRVVLTDFHPSVLSRLRTNVTLNGLETSCAVECCDWAEIQHTHLSRHPLLLGADLCASSRQARRDLHR